MGIDGYADPRGTDPYNQALSERRVNAIRDALIQAGVASFKIKTSAFGEQRLLCNESTADVLAERPASRSADQQQQVKARSITLAEQVLRPER